MYNIILEKDKETSALALNALIPKLQHLFKINILLYFIDFTASVITGNLFLVLAAYQTNFSLYQILYVIIAAIALFRATAFMHEAFHQGRRLKWMLTYYNFMHGFLHKIPSYCHDTHRFHHSPATYGTLQDPEYDTLGNKSSFKNLIEPPLKMLSLPLFLIIRWGFFPVLLPLLSPRGRLWIYTHSSTLAMNFKYNRPAPSAVEKRTWYLQDIGCIAYTAIVAGLIVGDVLPLKIIALWLVVFYLIAVVNAFRAMLNHRYFTGFNATTHKLQIIDSLTLPFSIYNAIFYPVGLGYHALHHVLPQIPYHNLGKAHRMLLETLPADHPYHITVIDSYLAGLKDLLAKRIKATN